MVPQKKNARFENDTLGTVCFDRLFPMGVAAMLEAVDLVLAGKHTRNRSGRICGQLRTKAGCRAAEAKINFNNHVDYVHNLIRCDPAPVHGRRWSGKGAALRQQEALGLHFGAVKGKPGEITAIGDTMFITAQGGQIEVAGSSTRTAKGRAREFAAAFNVVCGTAFGT